jgi:hypothetical protein
MVVGRDDTSKARDGAQSTVRAKTTETDNIHQPDADTDNSANNDSNCPTTTVTDLFRNVLRTETRLPNVRYCLPSPAFTPPFHRPFPAVPITGDLST